MHLLLFSSTDAAVPLSAPHEPTLASFRKVSHTALAAATWAAVRVCCAVLLPQRCCRELTH
jgi:hypothetical protein